MYIILVSYRARGVQSFRRKEVADLIQNVKAYFAKIGHEYKIVICEQNDDRKFNRGALLNIAFLLSEKLFPHEKKYIHMNADYRFNMERPFPYEIVELKSGFMELFTLPYPILGSACVFDPESYKVVNGFPNDLWGWGGDDWAIYNRIKQKHVPIFKPANIHNSGFIQEIHSQIKNDESNNAPNIRLAHRPDLETNGLNSCEFRVDREGEFHDGSAVFHYAVSF